MLGELRVALPGVQVLFAFLLVVPFNQRFPEITTFQTTVYFVTLLLATIASAFLIGPVAHHRVQFREQDKERIVITANRYAVDRPRLPGGRNDRSDPADHRPPLPLDHGHDRGRRGGADVLGAVVRGAGAAVYAERG